ncbi:hemerythrin domain-containing protein [Uniformispora flossi]|uniref:hemerythrin domain-containing protein n=1 Tax=Uniformispora flossi TaxID=3390723 RepID=UPI003C2FEAF5
MFTNGAAQQDVHPAQPAPADGPGPARRPGIVHELTAEHREIERLLTALQQASEFRARAQLARKLTGRMDRHLDVAETCLDPAVREHVTGGVGLVVKGRRDRDEIAVRIDELRMLDPDDERYPGVLARLRLGVSAHIRDEEDRVFVRLRGACTRAQQLALADRARGASLAGRS